MTTALVTVRPCDTLAHTVRLLATRGLSSLPVVDGSGSLVGMVSEFDLLSAYVQHDPAVRDLDDVVTGGRPRDVPVREVMSTRLLTLEPCTDLREAALLLVGNGVKAAPVVDGTRLVGIAARRDLLVALDADLRPSHLPADSLTAGGPSTLVGTWSIGPG